MKGQTKKSSRLNFQTMCHWSATQRSYRCYRYHEQRVHPRRLPCLFHAMAHPTEFPSTGVDFPIRWSQLSFTLHLKVLSPNQFGEIPPDWWGIYEQTAQSSQENTSARLVQCKICKIAKRCSAIGSLHKSHHLSLLSLIDTTWQPLTNRRAGACKCMMTAMKNQMLCIGTSGLSATFESGHTEKKCEMFIDVPRQNIPSGNGSVCCRHQQSLAIWISSPVPKATRLATTTLFASCEFESTEIRYSTKCHSHM